MLESDLIFVVYIITCVHPSSKSKSTKPCLVVNGHIPSWLLMCQNFYLIWCWHHWKLATPLSQVQLWVGDVQYINLSCAPKQLEFYVHHLKHNPNLHVCIYKCMHITCMCMIWMFSVKWHLSKIDETSISIHLCIYIYIYVLYYIYMWLHIYIWLYIYMIIYIYIYIYYIYICV